jgi:membrane associated rhomboid family serine protease/antitoxin component YwqK of YwqJK toxin-antitoxin module
MDLIRKSPATLALLVLNVVIFVIIYLQVKTFDEPEWTLHLLQRGAEFNPFTLDGQWYRIFTHMFLHGGVLHLAFNMYALYSVGTEIENDSGTRKFLWVYFLSGVAAGLVGLYWNLFSIGVGASGAIFGLFGFSLVTNFVRTRQSGQSVRPLVFNFALFLGINLYFAQAFHADTAAHLGGLACGMVIGMLSALEHGWFWRAKIQYAFIPIFIAVYFALPRYQVTYFKFFQSVQAAEDSARLIFGKNGSDEYYLAAFKKNAVLWDSSLTLINKQTYVPEALQSDTFKLRQYIRLRRKELTFRITMVERESYVYFDSIDIARDSMQHFYSLKYPLKMSFDKNKEQPADEEAPKAEPIKIYFNEEWEEVTTPYFTYFRIGTRDSLGRWQGRVTDYYANGDVQMKGMYKNDEQQGVFIYYSDHHTYTSAGRYHNDRYIGKWETYHTNGRLKTEEYYNDRYFLKNLWDSTGHQLVKDGSGKVIEHYPGGAVATEGEYRDGYQEGYWYGRHENGEMYYEENYYRGKLTKGRSRNLNGETFVYDGSSLFPLPEGGLKKLQEYLQRAGAKADHDAAGTVRLSFRVTDKRHVTDFKVIRSVSKITDAAAKQIVKEGPRWIPAKEHGDKKTDGFAFVDIEFR